MKRPRIALTGGIASGKTTVANMFRDLGAIVLDADQVARDVVQPGGPCWRQLRDLVGQPYFDSDGQLKRRELRSRIVEDPACRSAVNAILHPAILETMENQWREWQGHTPPRVVIFDIPLLYELHLESRFDCVILAYVTPDVQVLRLMTRDGLSRQEAEKSLAMQLPIESKREKAHIVIDNNRHQEATLEQVKATWKSLEERFGLPGRDQCQDLPA